MWYPGGAGLGFARVLIQGTSVALKVWLSAIVGRVEDWEAELGSKLNSIDSPLITLIQVLSLNQSLTCEKQITELVPHRATVTNQ